MNIRSIFLTILVITCTGLLFNQCSQTTKKPVPISDTGPDGSDTSVTIDGDFSIPELQIKPSPEKAFSLDCGSEKIVAYDISPAGAVVAYIAEDAGSGMIKFWYPGQNLISDSCPLPDGFRATALVWHPKATSLFVMGLSKTGYQICRFAKKNAGWVYTTVYRTDKELRNMIICPRPFITGYASGTDSMAYRLFFGMENGDKTFRIVSVTEYGKRFYQVIGPKGTFTGMEEMAADAEPSTIAAKWALPVAFHPGGHVMIWKDLNSRLNCAYYDSRAWGGSDFLKIPFKDRGTVIPLPNGLGFIHWQSDRPGIGVYMIPENKEDFQLNSFQFISPPRPFPDGKGVVGLKVKKGALSLE